MELKEGRFFVLLIVFCCRMLFKFGVVFERYIRRYNTKWGEGYSLELFFSLSCNSVLPEGNE